MVLVFVARDRARKKSQSLQLVILLNSEVQVIIWRIDGVYANMLKRKKVWVILISVVLPEHLRKNGLVLLIKQ